MRLLNCFFILFFTLLTSFSSLAQISSNVPNPKNNPPVDFSEPVNIVIFIILPICITILYFIWRREKRKMEEEMEK